MEPSRYLEVDVRRRLSVSNFRASHDRVEPIEDAMAAKPTLKGREDVAGTDPDAQSAMVGKLEKLPHARQQRKLVLERRHDGSQLSIEFHDRSSARRAQELIPLIVGVDASEQMAEVAVRQRVSPLGHDRDDVVGLDAFAVHNQPVEVEDHSL